jgi:ribosome-binding protein aMBF1 (putative translation factor)
MDLRCDNSPGSAHPGAVSCGHRPLWGPPPQRRSLLQPKKVPNPLDKHVGSRMRMRRMMLGFSQKKLGKELSVTFQQVQKYERA